LQDYNTLIDFVVVDHYISTKLLRFYNNPTGQLIDIIQTIIVHRPCGTDNPNALYIVTGALSYLPTYLKRFLKPFCPTTVIYKINTPSIGAVMIYGHGLSIYWAATMLL